VARQGRCGSRKLRLTGASASPEGYDPAHPTMVELQFIPHENDTTYLRITETGFTGEPDTQASRALEPTADSRSCSAR
jgi:hypothetical protein